MPRSWASTAPSVALLLPVRDLGVQDVPWSALHLAPHLMLAAASSFAANERPLAGNSLTTEDYTTEVFAPLLPPDVVAALETGAHVLTASPRAARALQAAFGRQCQANGRSSWRAPGILDWTSWTCALYNRLADSCAEDAELPLLLTPLQEEQLWQQVQTAEAELVVSPGSLARLAQEAYALLGDYDAHPSRRAPWAAAHQDAEHFLDWANAFEDLCRRRNVVSASLLNLRLASLLHQQTPTLPPALWLIGFDRHTPSEERVLESVRQLGVQIHTVTPSPSPPASRRIVSATTQQQELAACAFWVHEQITANPALRIGILVPQLAQARPQIDRVFRRLLTPESAQRAADGALPYEFSLGSPLAAIPIIYAALLLLRFTTGPLSAAEVSFLLTSGFLAKDASEASALSESDSALRKEGLLTTSLDLATLLRHCARRPALLPASVTARLSAAQAHQLSFVRPRTHTQWSQQVPALLEALGWPGHPELSSLPFQARQRWDALVEQLAPLDLVSGPVSWPTFVQQLSAATHQSLFAAEALDAPVQILGAAEAAGLTFDAVWFLSVQESNWPQPGRLHPLLAPALQQDAGMPHCTPQADQKLALLQIERIAASAPIVICSYAEQTENGEARPSPLLNAFSSQPHQPALLPDSVPDPLPAFLSGQSTPIYSARLEEEPAAVRPWPLDRPAGGSEVLKRQAACGFQAFAAKRLAAEEVEDESWGLDPGERATLLHLALECFWSPEASPPYQLHSLDDLQRAIGSGEVDDLIHHAVTCALSRDVAKTRDASDGAQDPWRAAYLSTEHQRLCGLLRQWLEVEQDRAPFTIDAVEQRLPDVQVGPLRLSLRADRIDSVDGGQALILDYKTAADVRPSQWLGDRPDEPQLPIYALYGGIPRVAGIAFAQIRPGCFNLKGLALSPAAQLSPRYESAKYQITPETVTEWDQSLRALAEQFSAGEAPVDPKRGAQTCAFCGLESICRISAELPESDVDPDSGDAETADAYARPSLPRDERDG